MYVSPLRPCIAGAGAIGCTLAASGQSVKVLARGAVLAAIRRNNIRLYDLDLHQAQVEVSH